MAHSKLIGAAWVGGILLAFASTGVASAQAYQQFPSPEGYPFRRSVRAPGFVAVPPYRHPFVIRTYTTPPQQPYYNVPPYSVIAPY